MRDPHDTATAENPGEVAPPLPAPRITQSDARQACGYTEPKSTKSCRNCRHRKELVRDEGSWAESVTVRCALHGFPVQKGATCRDFTA